MDRLEDKNPGNSIVDCVIPFLTAAQGGHLKICEFFINQLTDKNPGQNGWTPFHEAARSGKLDVCKLFMEKLEETNPISNNGLTVLYAPRMEVTQMYMNSLWKSLMIKTHKLMVAGLLFI